MPTPFEGKVEEYNIKLESKSTRPKPKGPPIRRLELRRGTESTEIRFKPEQLERYVGHPLDSKIKDLLDIAIAVYVQDRTIPRGPQWSRDLSLSVPVRNKALWDKNLGCLVSCLSELTEDVYSISFSRIRGEISDAQFKATNDRPVCLFSGGLDSYVGAAAHLESNPILVSHYSSSRVRSVQDRLAASLTTQKAKLDHYPVRVSLSGSKSTREASQLSRSFLFLSIGAAVAADTRSGNLIMSENGPIAINVRISESRTNTRTAHPKVLALFSTLVSYVFGMDIRVSNPFGLQTKGEIARKLVGTSYEKNLRHSVSCWRYPRGLISLSRSLHRPLLGNHCGICYPCIMRRVAMNAAGLHGADDQYLVDIFSEYPKVDTQTTATILDLLRFCDKVNDLGQLALIREYPDMAVRVGAITPEGVIEMHKRFSSEVIQCFRERGSAQLGTDFSSLLRAP